MTHVNFTTSGVSLTDPIQEQDLRIWIKIE